MLGQPSTLQPIETFYNGVLYRSRLEARWAVCFRELGIEAEYEREGFRLPSGESYLADWWFPQTKMWGETKPNDDRSRLVIAPAALRKGILLALGTSRPLIFFDGPPRHTNYWAIWPDEMDPVGWDWNDVVVTDGNRYHLDEHRFYASTGAEWPRHDLGLGNDLPAAIVAANSARFYRGRA